MELTSEERTYLTQREQELKSELDDLLTGRTQLQYVSPDERRTDLLDELQRIEAALRAEQSVETDED